MELSFIDEQIEEIIQGASLQEVDREYDLFLFRLKDNTYILYFTIIDIDSEEIMFSIMKEFDDLEMAQKEFEEYNFKE